MTLRDQLAELNAALKKTGQNAKRLKALRPGANEQQGMRNEPLASHWNRIGVRDRLRMIAAMLGGVPR